MLFFFVSPLLIVFHNIYYIFFVLSKYSRLSSEGWEFSGSQIFFQDIAKIRMSTQVWASPKVERRCKAEAQIRSLNNAYKWLSVDVLVGMCVLIEL